MERRHCRKSFRASAAALTAVLIGAMGGVLGAIAGPTTASADTTCATPFDQDITLNNSASSSNIFGFPTYRVPNGVHRVVLTAPGYAGFDWSLNGSHFSGGRGTDVKAVMDVTPGQALQDGFLDGGPGGSTPPGPSTGQNLDGIGPGGGNGGQAGFWALVGAPLPDVQQDPFADGLRMCLTPIVVAAGGGGAGGDPDIASAPPGASAGGNADTGTGAGAGGNGADNSAVDGGGGLGATATGGGAGGAAGHGAICPNGNAGNGGGLMSGGDGGGGHSYSQLTSSLSCRAGTGAGGGGAGYYFGGGGGSGEGTSASGGGGGGSPYVDPSLTLLSETAGPSIDEPALAPEYDTSTTLSSTPIPSVPGSSVTLTATVSTVNPAFRVGGGTVQFFDLSNSGVSLGSAPAAPNADGTATATFATSTLSPGSHSIGAFYLGYSAADYGDAPSHAVQAVRSAQTISFTSTAPTSPDANTTYTASATATSGLPVTLSSTPDSACSIPAAAVSPATVSFRTGGRCIILADQAGNDSYAAAPEVEQDVIVGKPQAIRFTSAAATPVIGSSYTPSATGGDSGNPVTFSVDPSTTNSACLQEFNSNEFFFKNLGTCVIDANQAASAAYAPAAMVQQTIAVRPADTTTALSSSSNPSTLGQPVTYTATVSVSAPGSGSPTGEVVFGDTPAGQGVMAPVCAETGSNIELLVGDTATCTVTYNSVGVHEIDARYLGDTDFNGSNVPGTLVQTAGSTVTTTLTPSSNPSAVGQSVTFTANVAANAPAAGTPTGTVTFDRTFNNGPASQLTCTGGTQTLDGSGNATCTATLSAAGSYAITAQYLGDTNFNTGKRTITQVVGRATSSTSVSSDTNPSDLGQPVTLTATVTGATGTPTPTGFVAFSDGQTAITCSSGSQTLDVNGSATCTASFDTAGSPQITAYYSGDANFGASSSSPLTQTVNQAASSTSVLSDTNPSDPGQQVTLSATVTGATDVASPTGSVAFYDGANPNPLMCGASSHSNLDSNGVATCLVTFDTAGGHMIGAEYSGDGNFTGSHTSAPITQSVSQVVPTVTLLPPPTPPIVGQPVIYAAHIGGSNGIAPTGTVTFYDGQDPITCAGGSQTLDAGGIANCVVTYNTAGTHMITASYSGDANFTPATSSPPLSVTITKAPQTVTFTSANPSPVTVGGMYPATATGSPSGIPVTITIDPATTNSSCTIDATNRVKFAHVGTCIIDANQAGNASYTAAPQVQQTITIGKAPLTVTADDQTITYGSPIPAPLTAKLFNGTTLQSSGVTGSASCSTVATTSSSAGTYQIVCTVGSLTSADYSFTTFKPGTLTIQKHPATLAYTGGLFFATPSTTATTANVTLQGQLTPVSGGSPDMTKAKPVFNLYKSTNLTMTTPDQTCSAAVSATGQVTCSITALGIDNWTVVLVLPASDGYFTAPAADAVVLTVYQPPTSTFATGGGWIVDPSYQNIPVAISLQNKHGNFGFNVRYKSGTTTPQGQAVYTFRGADGYDYIVKSNSWQGGGAAFTATTTGFSGKASVVVINPATGQVVSGLGGGNFTFRIDATKTNSGAAFAISVYGPTGTLYHQAGTTKSQIPLGSGNIAIHQ